MWREVYSAHFFAYARIYGGEKFLACQKIPNWVSESVRTSAPEQVPGHGTRRLKTKFEIAAQKQPSTISKIKETTYCSQFSTITHIGHVICPQFL